MICEEGRFTSINLCMTNSLFVGNSFSLETEAMRDTLSYYYLYTLLFSSKTIVKTTKHTFPVFLVRTV